MVDDIFPAPGPKREFPCKSSPDPISDRKSHYVGCFTFSQAMAADRFCRRRSHGTSIFGLDHLPGSTTVGGSIHISFPLGPTHFVWVPPQCSQYSILPPSQSHSCAVRCITSWSEAPGDNALGHSSTLLLTHRRAFRSVKGDGPTCSHIWAIRRRPWIP